MSETAVPRRGLLIPVLTTLLIVGALLSLGFWQLSRLADKRALIAALDERLAAQPVALPPVTQWGALSARTDEFRRVTLSGVVARGQQARVFASVSPLRKDITGTGAWLFAPVKLAGGEQVAVNLGFVPEGAAVPASQPGGPETLTGYIRFPEQAGWLTPVADMAKRLWFVRDPVAMAQALGWGPVAPFYIDLEAPVPPGGVPKPGPLQVQLKNDHLQYAITWFLLAAAVAIAFAVWLRGHRRA
ncbi:hypothetical protein X566_05870 [Afipia sp. P52-10]|uniref:SURF1 family protein n=1 Tax=Afipia sp. P52-10 TaxID=1429916 RepID=UPI0003DF3FD9|nr:SURF1 family protein [Afipia sp. P52-10]ETR77197.1 hypothetical protein X566_05870 [Afipia sp. P52-10]